MSLVTVFVQDEDRNPVVIWGVDKTGRIDYNKLLVGSEVIHIKELESGMRNLLSKMENLLKVDLGLLSTENILEKLKDETTRTSDGSYTSLWEANISLMKEADKFFNQKFGKIDQIQQNNAKLLNWLGKCDEFLEMMMVAIHISSGSPSRASELSSFLLKATDIGNRNVFYMLDTIAIYQTYHKALGIDNKTKNIVRFLPKEVAELLVKYLFYIRPAQR